MNNRSSYGDGGLAAIAIAVTIVIAMSWIIIATIMRLIAWIVCYILASFALALVVGMVVGVSAPLRVLMGRSVSKPDIATPEKVVARQVIRHQPAGFTKHFGWDKAWPEYNPYQAVRDAAAVYKEITRVRGAPWRKVRLSPRWVIRYDAYGRFLHQACLGDCRTCSVRWFRRRNVHLLRPVAPRHGRDWRGRLPLPAGMDDHIPMVGSRRADACSGSGEMPSLL